MVWTIARSSVIRQVESTLLLLFASFILVYLNMFILREREIQADRLAAFYLEDPLPLRRAIAICSSKHQIPNSPWAFSASSKISTFSSLFNLHPSPKIRNLYLYNNYERFVLSPGVALTTGFATILSVETGLRAIGVHPIGSGWAPLLSLSLDL